MNGDLAQSVALVSYGNAYLRGQVRTTAWSELSTFRFVATTRFFRHHRMWMIIPQRTLVAESAEAWLQWLRRTTATALRLEVASTGRWVVRTESAEASYVWRQKSRHIGGAGRGWEVTYHGHIDRGGGHHRAALDIATAASNLNRALDAAIHLTHTGQLVEWERRFAAAKATLLAEGRLPRSHTTRIFSRHPPMSFGDSLLRAFRHGCSAVRIRGVIDR